MRASAPQISERIRGEVDANTRIERFGVYERAVSQHRLDILRTEKSVRTRGAIPPGRIFSAALL